MKSFTDFQTCLPQCKLISKAAYNRLSTPASSTMLLLVPAWLFVFAVIGVGPTIGGVNLHYSKGICAGTKKDKFALPGAKNGEQVEIIFECDGTDITHCNLPNMPRVSLNQQFFQTYVGQDGREYMVTCWRELEPEIQENFPANICKTEHQTAEVAFPEKGSKPISVKFRCDVDSPPIKSCQPAETATVKAGKNAIIDGPAGKSKYRFSCIKDARPTLALTFAGDICGRTKKSEEYTVGKKSNPQTVAFDCNDDNNRITLCKPKGYLLNVKVGEMRHFGLTKDSEFDLFCYETDRPAFY